MQYTFWDKLKIVADMNVQQSSHLVRLLAYLIAHGSLSLTILKVLLLCSRLLPTVFSCPNLVLQKNFLLYLSFDFLIFVSCSCAMLVVKWAVLCGAIVLRLSFLYLICA